MEASDLGLSLYELIKGTMEQVEEATAGLGWTLHHLKEMDKDSKYVPGLLDALRLVDSAYNSILEAQSDLEQALDVAEEAQQESAEEEKKEEESK